MVNRDQDTSALSSTSASCTVDRGLGGFVQGVPCPYGYASPMLDSERHCHLLFIYPYHSVSARKIHPRRQSNKIPRINSQIALAIAVLIAALCLACTGLLLVPDTSHTAISSPSGPAAASILGGVQRYGYMLRTFFSGLRSSPAINNMAPKKQPPPPTLPTAVKSREEAQAGEGGECPIPFWLWVMVEATP